MYYINLLIITFIVCFIVDYSGIMNAFRRVLNRRLKREEKEGIPPWDCSLCMTFWTGLAYTIISGPSVLRLAAVCICAILARFITELIYMCRDVVNALVSKLSKIVDAWIEKLES